jgi:hypothetical protein
VYGNRYWASIKIVVGEHAGDLFGETDGVMVVVAAKEQGVDEGWEYSPAKWKILLHLIRTPITT